MDYIGTVIIMSQTKKNVPAKIQGSETVRIRLSGPKYAALKKLASTERRKISNMAQVFLEEGLEKRGVKA